MTTRKRMLYSRKELLDLKTKSLKRLQEGKLTKKQQVDNLPVIFLPKLCETYGDNKKKVPKLAVVIDFRSYEDVSEVFSIS